MKTEKITEPLRLVIFHFEYEKMKIPYLMADEYLGR